MTKELSTHLIRPIRIYGTDEEAIDYWYKQILKMQSQRCGLKKITFNFRVYAKRSLIDKALRRYPTVEKRFTTSDGINFHFTKKGELKNNTPVERSHIMLEMSAYDECSFLSMGPVDSFELGGIACGYLVVSNRIYNAVRIYPTDIVSMEFSEEIK